MMSWASFAHLQVDSDNDDNVNVNHPPRHHDEFYHIGFFLIQRTYPLGHWIYAINDDFDLAVVILSCL